MKNWRRSREYRLWRASVVRRDKKCVICGRRAKRQAHHIKNGAHHKEVRFDISNGITLCGGRGGCHTMLHTVFKKSYRHKTTIEDWEDFHRLSKHYILLGQNRILKRLKL